MLESKFVKFLMSILKRQVRDSSLVSDLAHSFSILDKRIPSKSQFWHFQVFQFLISFSKPQISFSSNFAWNFGVMKDNSSVLLRSNVIYFALKEPIKVQITETSESSEQNSPNFCHFWNNKLVFLQILDTLLSKSKVSAKKV